MLLGHREREPAVIVLTGFEKFDKCHHGRRRRQIAAPYVTQRAREVEIFNVQLFDSCYVVGRTTSSDAHVIPSPAQTALNIASALPISMTRANTNSRAARPSRRVSRESEPGSRSSSVSAASCRKRFGMQFWPLHGPLDHAYIGDAVDRGLCDHFGIRFLELDVDAGPYFLQPGENGGNEIHANRHARTDGDVAFVTLGVFGNAFCCTARFERDLYVRSKRALFQERSWSAACRVGRSTADRSHARDRGPVAKRRPAKRRGPGPRA